SRVDGVGYGALEQRVSVLRRMGDEIGGNVAAGAGAIFDHELLAEEHTELLRQHSRGNIARGAGTETHDDPHGVDWIVFSLRRGDTERQRKNERRNVPPQLHIHRRQAQYRFDFTGHHILFEFADHPAFATISARDQLATNPRRAQYTPHRRKKWRVEGKNKGPPARNEVKKKHIIPPD